MNLWTIARYQLGNADAIQTVASSRAAIPVGIALVLLTGIARNYDQNYWRETPFWLIGPLLFSFASGSFLFMVLYQSFIRRHLPEGENPSQGGQWLSFMGLFWMTAPIAWLYAIPVERVFDSVGAAKANITLLAIVSLWRVLLMGRVVSVVNNVPFLRGVGWVLIGASMEVIAVLFFGTLFSPTFGKRIVAGMSGMRNAPEENILSSALGTAWWGAILVLVLLGIALAARRVAEQTRPFPRLLAGRFPWGTLGALVGIAAIWTAVAIGPQREQQHFAEHARLVTAGNYKEALIYLQRHQPSDFPPGRRLEPNPYEYRVWEHLPPTIALMTTNTPPWIRDVYFGHFRSVLNHHWANFSTLSNVVAMVQAMERIPEGRECLLTNQHRLANFSLLRARYRRNDDDNVGQHATILTQTLQRIGVAETNLLKITQH